MLEEDNHECKASNEARAKIVAAKEKALAELERLKAINDE